MKEAIKKLSTAELQIALEDVLKCHQDHYDKVGKKEEDVIEAFHQLAGNIISIREQFKLPTLK